MRNNSFSKKMKSKSDQELETIFDKKDNYTDEAIQAVIWELEDRKLIEKSEVSFVESQIKNEEIIETDIDENKSPFEDLELPFLYSKKAIQGFTIFFSTIFGAVLLMSNFKATNNLKARNQVLIFGIGYTILSTIFLNFLPRMFFLTLLFNFVGYAILIEFFWNKTLGKDIEYRKKQIWKPLIISIAILIVFVLIQFLPQTLEQ